MSRAQRKPIIPRSEVKKSILKADQLRTEITTKDNKTFL